MKKITFLLLLFLSFVFSYSQQAKIDSLKKEFKNSQNDSLRIKIIEKIVMTYYYSNMKEGLPYADTLLSYSKRQNNYELICLSYRYYGNYFMNKGTYEKAIKEFRKSLRINDSISFPKGLYGDYTNIGNAYRYNIKNDSAFFYYNKAIEIVEKYKLTSKYTTAYQNIAALYYDNNESQAAIKYFIKALDSSYYLKDASKKRVAPIYANVGTIFLDMGNYKKAEEYLISGIELSKKINYSIGIADTELKLARAYYERGVNLKKAEMMLQSCIKIYKEQGDNRFLAEAYLNLGDLYISENKLNKSIIVKKKAMAIIKKNEQKDSYYSVISSIARSYFKQKQYKLSLKYINTIIEDTADIEMTNRVKITLFRLKSRLEYINYNYKKAYFYNEKYRQELEKKQKVQELEKITEIETKYQTEKKEKENLQLKKDNTEQTLILQKEKQKKIYFGAALIASLLFIVIFAYFFRSNKKQKKLIENLQKELHHRIKNNLSVIDTFIEVAKEEFEAPAFNNKLTELQNRIAGINEVHKQLYTNQDITNLHVKKYIKTLADNVASSFNNSNVELIQEIDNSLKLYANKSFPVGLIINEFITNSFKYAFGENIKGKINIKMQETKNAFSLLLSDNGKGLPENFNIDKIETFGMRIMKLLTEQLKGTFKLESINGVKINIQFPK